jgi:hypothetical protein
MTSRIEIPKQVDESLPINRALQVQLLANHRLDIVSERSSAAHSRVLHNIEHFNIDNLGKQATHQVTYGIFAHIRVLQGILILFTGQSFWLVPLTPAHARALQLK